MFQAMATIRANTLLQSTFKMLNMKGTACITLNITQNINHVPQAWNVNCMHGLSHQVKGNSIRDNHALTSIRVQN